MQPQQEPYYYASPQNPPPTPKSGMSNAKILLIVFGSLAALCLIAGIGSAFNPKGKSITPIADGNAGTPAPYDTSGPDGQKATASAASAAPPVGPLTSFGDGTHEVGGGAGQISPGTYVATVPASPFPLCMWSRLKGFSGEGKDTITFGTGSEGEKMRVTIAATDKGFETDRCGTWTKA